MKGSVVGDKEQGVGIRDKGQGIMDKGQGIREKGQGIRPSLVLIKILQKKICYSSKILHRDLTNRIEIKGQPSLWHLSLHQLSRGQFKSWARRAKPEIWF